MKKLFTILLCTLVTITSLDAAPKKKLVSSRDNIKKGTMTIGGHIGLNGGGRTANDYLITGGNNTNTTLKSPVFNMSLSPQFSYFLIDNLEIKAGFEYNLEGITKDTEGTTTVTSSMHSLGVTTGLTYYLPVLPKFYYAPGFDWLLGGCINSVKLKEAGQPTANNNTMSGFYTHVTFNLAGFELKLTPKWALHFDLAGLDIQYADIKTKVIDDNIAVTTGTAVSEVKLAVSTKFGFKYFF